mmetsp:Transcript_25933/g.36151  ORF Transcript_25933/g.36151 Transcript_25933/m.36151 type:complete len:144 (+) Transcript_25933:631-1062(+)
MPRKLLHPSSAKGKGKHNKQLENNMRFSFQNALKRHVLLKRARALFTLPCARADFIALFKGTFDVHEEGPRLVVDVSGADTAEVVRKLSPLVGENNDWWCRRCCGNGERRDCACINAIPAVKTQKQCDIQVVYEDAQPRGCQW